MLLNTDNTQNKADQQSDRSDNPLYVRKKGVRVKLRTSQGVTCIGTAHVMWPNGRISDLLNDERRFIPVTDVVIEGDPTRYDILTINKDSIELLFEIHRTLD